MWASVMTLGSETESTPRKMRAKTKNRWFHLCDNASYKNKKGYLGQKGMICLVIYFFEVIILFDF